MTDYGSRYASPKENKHPQPQQEQLSTFHKSRDRNRALQNEPLNLKLLIKKSSKSLTTFIGHHDFLLHWQLGG